MRIHHVTLKSCMLLGTPYLNHFIFLTPSQLLTPYKVGGRVSLAQCQKSKNKTQIPFYKNCSDFIAHVQDKRASFKRKHPTTKTVVATHMKNKTTQTFDSCRVAAEVLNIDRGTLRKYMHNRETKLYKGVWRFSEA